MKKNKTSGIVYYYINDITLECRVYENNISIIDSYQIKSDKDKEDVIEDLLNAFVWFKEYRTTKDMLDEWRVHNFCYSINFKRSHTQTVDLELQQSRFHKFIYKLVSKFIKKNI